ncbi:hypothetical protein FZW96_03350 [Bacillus sp. BGMRC 2118]|nr:hypothetical protein FZW96_03350 [Bacillus sp. BGMRC 2118]
MNVSLPMNSLTYGTLKLPDDWNLVLQDFMKTNHSNLSLDHFYSFQWSTHTRNGTEYIPLSGSSSSAHYEDEVIDFVPFLNEIELE